MFSLANQITSSIAARGVLLIASLLFQLLKKFVNLLLIFCAYSRGFESLIGLNFTKPCNINVIILMRVLH